MRLPPIHRRQGCQMDANLHVAPLSARGERLHPIVSDPPATLQVREPVQRAPVLFQTWWRRRLALVNSRVRIGNGSLTQRLPAIAAGGRHNPCYVRVEAIGNCGMPTDITREELQHLEARVGVVEQEVEGRKMGT